MCAYMNIDYQSPELWRALLMLCLPLPASWSYDQTEQQFYCSNEKEFQQLKSQVVNLTKQPIIFHPCDPVVASIDMQNSTNSIIIPYLTGQEASKIPKNFIFAYDFSQMQPVLLPMIDKLIPQLISISPFQLDFLYENEIYSAAIQANETVFRAKSGLLKKEILVDLKQEFANLLQIQEQNKQKFDRQTVQKEQREGQAMNSLQKMQRRFIMQPEINFEFLASKLSQIQEMECYGYQLIDKKYFQMYLSKPIQNQDRVQICQDFDGQQQVQAIMSFSNKQSKCRIQEIDYPQQFDQFDFKLGWMLQIGKFTFSISQLNKNCEQNLKENLLIIKNWCEKLEYYDSSAGKLNFNQYWSGREMLNKIIWLCSVIKSKVDFLDVDWVFM